MSKVNRPQQQMREQALSGLRTEIDANSILTAAAFRFLINTHNGPILKILCRDNENYIFEIFEEQGAKRWRITENPGVYLLASDVTYDADFTRSRQRVFAWIRRVEEDMLNKIPPSSEAWDRMTEQVINGLPEPENPCSEEEVGKIIAGLTGLVSRLKEEIKLQDHQISQLTRELETLRKRAPDMPKVPFVRAAFQRTRNLIFTGAMTEAGKQLISQFPKLLSGGE